MSSSEESNHSDLDPHVETLVADADARGSFVQQTSFDAYFFVTSRAPKTSANIFTDLVTPLTLDEYTAAIQPVKASLPLFKQDHEAHFPQYLRELATGFNLLFYGWGSKRDMLAKFSRTACARHGHVIIVEAFRPSFALKDLLSSVEQVPGILDLDIVGPGPEAQAQRIRQFFSNLKMRPLYLIIHNIDAPALRTARARACLSLMALAPQLRLAASVDHLNAPLLFASGEANTRKQHEFSSATPTNISSRGYAWLWHNLTSLTGYDTELAFANRSSISGASASASTKAAAAQEKAGAAPDGSTMSETAAQHVLASVTQKAKKLFVMMSQQQLGAIEAGGNTATSDAQQFAIGYDVLFNLARDNFIATTDGALRALLGEFRDHGLVQSVASTGGSREGLWIPLRRERMVKLLQLIQAD